MPGLVPPNRPLSVSTVSARVLKVTLLAVMYLACSSGTATRSADVVALEALELSTTYTPNLDTLTAFSGTVQLHNPLNRPVSVVLRTPCSVIVRVYRLDAGVTDAVWDQERYPGGCKSFPFDLTIDAGGTHALQFGPIDASFILNDSLPAGRYRLAVFIAERGGPSANGAELTVTTAVLQPF